MTRRDWIEHFEEVWPTPKLAKGRYDRDHLLAPGQGIFPKSGQNVAENFFTRIKFMVCAFKP